MSIEQKLKVQDELQIITSYNAGQSIGKLTFVLPDTTNTVFGQIRSIGSYPYGALLIDCSGMSSGIKFKTNSTQGYSNFGGIGNPFAAEISSYSIFSGSVRLDQPQYLLSTSGTQILNESGGEMLFCSRNGTSGNTGKDFNVIKAVQNNFKIGETMSITVGSDAYNAYRTVLGFSTPSGYPTGDCVGFVGLQKDGFPDVNTKSLVWDINGNVNVPFALSVTGTTNMTGNLVCQNDLQSNSATITTTLTADTLSATTYVGLPAFDPAVLDPITLDTVNDRVGINQVTPTEALDVTGNIKSSGTITGDTVSATTYVGLPAFDPAVLDPITLDTVNDRVGINQVTPTEALDVTGNIKSSGTITGNTVSATTYIGLPSSSVLPITLDTVNNRVGINKTVPTEALDVTGNIVASGTVTATSGNVIVNNTLIKSNTGTPEGSVTAIVGSLFLRKDGAAGTTLYTKVTGTGNTGWLPLSVSTGGTLYSSGVKNSPLVPSGTAIGTFLVDTTQSIEVGVYTISLNAWIRKPSTTVVTGGSVLLFGYSIGTGTTGVGAGIRNGGLVAGLSSDYQPSTVQMVSYVGTSHYLWGTLTSIFTITATTNLRIGWQQRVLPTASTPAGTFTVEYDYVLEKLN